MQYGTYPVALQGTQADLQVLTDIHQTLTPPHIDMLVLNFAGHPLVDAPYNQTANYHETDGLMGKLSTQGAIIYLSFHLTRCNTLH